MQEIEIKFFNKDPIRKTVICLSFLGCREKEDIPYFLDIYDFNEELYKSDIEYVKCYLNSYDEPLKKWYNHILSVSSFGSYFDKDDEGFCEIKFTTIMPLKKAIFFNSFLRVLEENPHHLEYYINKFGYSNYPELTKEQADEFLIVMNMKESFFNGHYVFTPATRLGGIMQEDKLKKVIDVCIKGKQIIDINGYEEFNAETPKRAIEDNFTIDYCSSDKLYGAEVKDFLGFIYDKDYFYKRNVA